MIRAGAQSPRQTVHASRGAHCGSIASWIFANAHAMFATSITASDRQRAIACNATEACRQSTCAMLNIAMVSIG